MEFVFALLLWLLSGWLSTRPLKHYWCKRFSQSGWKEDGMLVQVALSTVFGLLGWLGTAVLLWDWRDDGVPLGWKW